MNQFRKMGNGELSKIENYAFMDSVGLSEINVTRLRWVGHIQIMKNTAIVLRIVESKSERVRKIGRPTNR